MARDVHGRRLRLLLDTNIVIEHADSVGPVAGSPVGRLIRLAHDLGFELLVSYGTRRDFTRANPQLKADRARLLDKYYRTLEPVSEDAVVRAQFPADLSANDRADVEVLSTFAAKVATVLVTEDERMRARARRAGLDNVFGLEAALDWLRALQEPTMANAASASMVRPYQVSLHARLFDSLKEDYPFTDWWANKVVEEDRPVIVVGRREDPDGVAVLKAEADVYGLGPRVLKICTFKVGDGEGGSRRGELLLRAVVDYAVERRFPVAYLTAWPHHEKLTGWLERFGFRHHATQGNGELVMVKQFTPNPGQPPLAPLEHAIRYGPRSVRVERAYLVPIRATYHARLLPDSDNQISLLENEACGNAIRKAYLCHAGIRKLEPGDVLLFLRTQQHVEARVTAVGVVEQTVVSEEPYEVAAFVAGRTVYSYREIQAMCAAGEVLAIRFRLDRRVDPPWRAGTLVGGKVMTRSPQSIATVPEEGVRWVREQLGGQP